MTKITQHHEMPRNSLLYLKGDEGEDRVLRFVRMDGAYSHCLTTDNKVCGFWCGMPVEPYKDGFRCLGDWND